MMHSLSSSHCGKRLFTLIEVLAYMAVAIVIIGLGTRFFLDALQTSVDLRNAGEDILRVNRFGDQWREDRRDGQVRVPAADSADGVLCTFISDEGQPVVYRRTSEKTLVRETTNGQQTSLSRVANAEIVPLPGISRAWRLDLELAPRRYPADVKPLFTFIAAEARETP